MTKISIFVRHVILPIMACALIISGCDDDDEPMTGTIHGTITIENADLWATWADSGEVQITVFPEFSLDPPAGWGAGPSGTFAYGAPVNAQNPYILEYSPGVSEYDFEIELDPGTYSALAVGFRHDFIQDPSLRSATLGVYWNMPTSVSHGITIPPAFNEPAPESFTVSAGENLELNFQADFGFVQVWF
jgi:hypothetical protein